jgi:hypothetical protein
LILAELSAPKTPKEIMTSILAKNPDLNTIEVGELRKEIDDLMLDGVIGYITSYEKLCILDNK